MRKTSTKAALATAVVLMLAPAVAAASPTEKASGPTDPVSLEQQAQALYSQPAKYGKAAGLLVKAAEARQVGDAVRLDDLVLAARLSYYNGDLNRALKLMRRAAEEALSIGDVVTAAHAFTDSAYIGKEAGAVEVAAAMLESAQRLTYSPLIDETTREEIRKRITVDN